MIHLRMHQNSREIKVYTSARFPTLESKYLPFVSSAIWRRYSVASSLWASFILLRSKPTVYMCTASDDSWFGRTLYTSSLLMCPASLESTPSVMSTMSQDLSNVSLILFLLSLMRSMASLVALYKAVVDPIKRSSTSLRRACLLSLISPDCCSRKTTSKLKRMRYSSSWSCMAPRKSRTAAFISAVLDPVIEPETSSTSTTTAGFLLAFHVVMTASITLVVGKGS
mmetsp:Transcript_30203/g.75014  ORF Transcript_30203/g.75014 Transcript_30203/m.75014 type:complete len:225 (+) Transcript_30203:229-903(+)